MTKTIEIRNQKIKYSIDGDTIKVFVYGTSGHSSGFRNIMADIICSAKCWKNKNGFHAGTWEAAKMILDNKEFIELIEDKTIVIGGHSMGAAVAECMAAIIEFDNIGEVEHLITFGGYQAEYRPIHAYWTNRFVQ